MAEKKTQIDTPLASDFQKENERIRKFLLSDGKDWLKPKASPSASPSPSPSPSPAAKKGSKA